MPSCKNCGEILHGDGYKTVYHCPNAIDQKHDEIDCAEPDANAINCSLIMRANHVNDEDSRISNTQNPFSHNDNDEFFRNAFKSLITEEMPKKNKWKERFKGLGGITVILIALSPLLYFMAIIFITEYRGREPIKIEKVDIGEITAISNCYTHTSKGYQRKHCDVKTTTKSFCRVNVEFGGGDLKVGDTIHKKETLTPIRYESVYCQDEYCDYGWGFKQYGWMSDAYKVKYNTMMGASAQ